MSRCPDVLKKTSTEFLKVVNTSKMKNIIKLIKYQD